jgi:hypothetical protein
VPTGPPTFSSAKANIDQLSTSKNHDSMVARKMELSKLKKEESPIHCVLEFEGICMELYNFLWTKEARFQTNCQGILIPDTVIIKNGAIYNWFLYSKGKVVKKRKENCTLENIKNSFLSNKLPCEVVCQFIKFSKEKAKNEYEIRHFKAADFSEFVNNLSKDYETGILQKFIEPRGEKNSVIRFSWSREICSSEIIQSKAKLNDTKIDIYERCNILSRDPRYVDTRPVRGELIPTSIDAMVENISKHIFQTSQGVYILESGTFFFKLCKNNQLWFQFSSSMKVHGTRDDLLVNMKYEN